MGLWCEPVLLQGLNWDCLRCYSSTGEASSPEDYHWLVALAGYKPVIEYCGGTEIGGGFLGGTLVQPQAASHFSTPTIGCRLALLDDQEVMYDSLQGSLLVTPNFSDGTMVSCCGTTNLSMAVLRQLLPLLRVLTSAQGLGLA